MDQDYIKYLNTEREISEFKINSLKKMMHKGDASTRRLLAIEEEFLKIPFEKVANSLSELLSAIKIFRDSRNAFYELFPIQFVNNHSSNQLIEWVKNKLKEKIKDLENEISSSKIKIAREKSRLLIILLCTFVYLEKTQEELKRRNLSIEEKDILEEISLKYADDIFMFYNEIIININDFSFLSEKSKLFLSEIKPLYNISEFSDGTFLSIKSERLRGKNVFGFHLNSRHSGRETLKPYYMKLYDEDGLNISKLFSLYPKVSMVENEYYKFIYLLPLNEIKENILLLERYESLMKKIFHLKLSGKPNLKINATTSSILVPASRTEDESLKVGLLESSAIFSNILKSII